MFWGRGNRKDQLKRFRFQSAPLSTRLSPERHRQHTPRATRTRTRGGGAAFGVMNSPPRTQRTSSTARRSPGSGPRGRYKWMMAAYLCGEILADVCMTSFTFHCCAGLATTGRQQLGTQNPHRQRSVCLCLHRTRDTGVEDHARAPARLQSPQMGVLRVSVCL